MVVAGRGKRRDNGVNLCLGVVPVIVKVACQCERSGAKPIQRSGVTKEDGGDSPANGGEMTGTTVAHGRFSEAT